MAELTPDIAPQVVEASTTNAEEIVGAFSRAFDGEFVFKAQEAAPHDASAAPSGEGLAMLFAFGDEGAAVLIPASGGMLPDWCRDPDPTGESKLSTLAQELSMLLMPDTLMADRFEATWVGDLGETLGCASPSEGAQHVALELVQDEQLTEAALIWPLDDPDALLEGPIGAAIETPTTTTDNTESTDEEATEESGPTQQESTPLLLNDYRDLPANALSLLQVPVELSVDLAQKKMSIEDIIDLGPGSIITFDKACNGLLDITIGSQSIAQGEAVKVGEKFGVRVKKMILPQEHFKQMHPAKQASA